MSLKDRVKRLEQDVANNAQPERAIWFMNATEEQLRDARLVSNYIVNFVTVDCSRAPNVQ